MRLSGGVGAARVGLRLSACLAHGGNECVPQVFGGSQEQQGRLALCCDLRDLVGLAQPGAGLDQERRRDAWLGRIERRAGTTRRLRPVLPDLQIEQPLVMRAQRLLEHCR
ncbi:MAG: hypothetical protein B7X43_01400 [Thiomonas sp. 15-63-373]|jgi:hypothetical protein|nr:MAG: hypothetical protein B7X43_01400 [Thiomonas sp. 15-63-373]